MKFFFPGFLLAALAGADAAACSCSLRTLNEFVDEADSIYVAKPQEAKLVEGDFGRRGAKIEGRFLVRSVLKGPSQGKSVTLVTGTGGGDCGVPMLVSARYLIFTQGGSNGISDCGGSTMIDGFEEDEITAKIRSLLKSSGNKPK